MTKTSKTNSTGNNVIPLKKAAARKAAPTHYAFDDLDAALEMGTKLRAVRNANTGETTDIPMWPSYTIDSEPGKVINVMILPRASAMTAEQFAIFSQHVAEANAALSTGREFYRAVHFAI